MRYWDASALVPLVVSEPNSDLSRSWLADDSAVITWAWTRVEIVSAIERRTREGALSRQDRRQVIGRLETFADTWDEVTEVLAVRSRASLLLARHPLRDADAGQLGAALLISEQLDGESLPFMCLDRRLSEAAELEGLGVLDW
ncbi:type II toxin-antitoxin system VapC family toxin [Candidatus Poriferisocius sp.]|uniref:type II toxin-antitoxin system VapC family toxin n=1 Tax=Candidatus Poriferisocius sp. TaxID=3101276 RepID=UPI003B013502